MCSYSSCASMPDWPCRPHFNLYESKWTYEHFIKTNTAGNQILFALWLDLKTSWDQVTCKYSNNENEKHNMKSHFFSCIYSNCKTSTAWQEISKWKRKKNMTVENTQTINFAVERCAFAAAGYKPITSVRCMLWLLRIYLVNRLLHVVSSNRHIVST